ncbi:helix-turn-helix domain-containing protein [Pacificibacter marinus]|uniref:HTH-type transcriptional regulator PuuR n=1 Tax=Pacificibacter marinus TaxID=658057 RepID=A0A1Y5RFU5_9RHOB|nr:cupin domain-containing protein [Pacificibacter marinus]SEK20981.1 transcriptional regulator, XRE family with cupin sensor [Pacificibacter marinus]SLN16521.1 HTH-type transcriptional regulator PuuR [Pacificibacter marinus]
MAVEKPEPQLGSAIRKRRKQMNLTLQALCNASGVSVGYLSQVERDNATPSLGTLAQIADALDVGLEYFIATPKPSDGLTRADQRPRFSLAHSSLTYEALAANFPGSELSSYLLNIPAGYVSETVSHEGEEIIYVLEGKIEQTLDGQTFSMTAGDCLHYSGQTPHAWRNPTDAPARLLWTGTLTVLTRTGAIELPELSHKQEAI